MDVDLRLQHQLLAVETEHDVHAMVELSAPSSTGPSTRPPLSLALVIDRSGSMQGEPLETAKRSAAFLAEQLLPTDELAVVAYDDAVELVAPLAAVDATALKHAIAGIQVGGMTNLSGGWLKGLEQLAPAAEDHTRRVLLLTDGQANVGITDATALAGLTGGAASDGVGTTTIGFGDGFNEHLLTAMADAGRGNGWFAEGVDDVPGIFADEFAGLVELAAQNVSVEVRPSEDVALIGVLNEYPTVGVPGGVQVQVGDAYAGQRLRVVLSLHVPQLAGLGPRRIADVIVRYVAVGTTVSQHEVSYPLHVNLVSADEAAAVGPDPTVTEEVTVLLAARATDEARRLADDGQLDLAHDALRTAIHQIRASAVGSDREDALLAKAEDLARTADNLEHGLMTAADAKRLHYRSHEIKRNRYR